MPWWGNGVQMGTRFIASGECSMPDGYKEAIVRSGEDDIDWTTKLTGIGFCNQDTRI